MWSKPWRYGESRRVASLAMTANNEDGSQPPAAPSESEPLSTTDTAPNSSSASASEHASSSSPPTSDHSELLDRARHFLNSPQVIDQDLESKRRFLAGKGLTDGGIQLLLRETVRLVHIYPLRHSMFDCPKSIRSCQSCHHECIPHLYRPVCQAFS